MAQSTTLFAVSRQLRIPW